MNVLLRKTPENLQVDRLLGVHKNGIVIRQHVIDDLEPEGKVAIFLKVHPTEARLGLGLNDLLYDRWDLDQFLVRCLVGHAEDERHAALVHASIVADAAAQQIGIGKDELFAGETADARALEADVLYRADVLPDGDGIANDEGFIQDDGEWGAPVAVGGLCNSGQGMVLYIRKAVL